MTVPLPQPVKCLLVHDQDESLLAFETAMKGQGQILRAHSGEEAREVIRAQDVDLVVVDVAALQRSDFTNGEAMGEARAIAQALEERGAAFVSSLVGRNPGAVSQGSSSAGVSCAPLILLCEGSSDAAQIGDAYGTGAVDVLFKPVDPRLLQHKVRVVVQLHRERRMFATRLHLNQELMAVVGHDLRNPLQAVLMTASVLGRTSKEPETVKASERLRSSGTRILRIVDDLMDLSRVRPQGGVPVQPRPMDLRVVLEKAVGEAEAANQGRRIALAVDGDSHGVWDPQRMAQAVTALLSCALKESEGSQPLRLALQGRESEVHLRLEHDSPPSEVPLADTRRPEGVSLGLYLVRQIAFSHGGTFEMTRAAGKTVLELVLPRRTSVGQESGSGN